MKLTIVAGARPNFMKIAPIIRAIEKVNEESKRLDVRLVHTGQHSDRLMSETFFDELNIPEPDVNLSCNGGSQAAQTASIMIEFEKELLAHRPDLVVVVGDVTSTMAGAIVAKKLNCKVAHVEGGIRSFDMTMPEEINRLVTDSIADYFFTTSATANRNLIRSGASPERMFFVGNVMIDTLLQNQSRFSKPMIFDEFELSSRNYFVLTMHRPGNVDDSSRLRTWLDEIVKNTRGLPIIFPVHPRTAKVLSEIGVEFEKLIIVKPLGYLNFNYLVKHSKAVITDSGGITEEATVLGTPCLTLRANTERPETVEIGTNELVGEDPKNIKSALDKLLDGNWKKGRIPEKWDGRAAERIVQHLLDLNRK